MNVKNKPFPSPESESPFTPVWMPSQFKGMAARVRGGKGSELEDRALGETIANAVSNGVGAALAVAGLVVLIVMAVLHGGGTRLLVALAFAVPMLLAFLMSTLYHAIPGEVPRAVFRVLGHSFVFLYIAGSFTPYCMLLLADAGGPALCGAEWLLAVVGVFLEALWVNRPRWVQLALCCVMGLAGLPLVPALSAVIAPTGMALLTAAAILFLVGLAFYVFRKVPYLWFVSHLLVLAGSICLFLSVVLFVI